MGKAPPPDTWRYINAIPPHRTINQNTAIISIYGHHNFHPHQAPSIWMQFCDLPPTRFVAIDIEWGENRWQSESRNGEGFMVARVQSRRAVRNCCAMASTDPSQAVWSGAARLGGAYSVANSISQLVAHAGGHKSFAMENEARTRASNTSDSWLERAHFGKWIWEVKGLADG